MRRRARSSLAALLLVPLLAPARGQEVVPGTFGERIDVEVVNVDVVVTDRSGRRVTDLARGEFELRVDGEPVPIDYFVAPATPAPQLAAPAVEPLASPPRALPAASERATLVFFVDQSALQRRHRQQTVAELRDFLSSSADPERRVMVAAFQDDLRLLAAPTTDPGTIAAALAGLEKLPARSTATDAERTRLEIDIRSYGKAAPMVRTDLEAGGLDDALAGLMAEQDAWREEQRASGERVRIQNEIELWALQELDRQSRAVRALGQIVDALGAVEGRKAVVLATAGYSFAPASFLLDFFAEKLGLAEASLVTRIPRLDELGIRLAQDFERMVAAAEDARVAFYTIAPRSGPDARASAEFASAGEGSGAVAPPPRDLAAIEAASSVTRLAAATGGRTFYLDEGLGNRLAEVAADESAVYSLGFTTSAAAGSGDHRIEVRLARADLQVRHRESFRRLKSAERGAAALVAAATLGTARNPFGLRLELGAAAPGAAWRENAKLPFAVRIPLAAIALVPRGTAREGKLLLQVAVQEASGKLFFDPGTPIPIAIPASDLERALAGVWVHRAELALEPGRHRVAVLVSDEQGGDFSAVAEMVDVGAP